MLAQMTLMHRDLMKIFYINLIKLWRIDEDLIKCEDLKKWCVNKAWSVLNLANKWRTWSL